MKKFDKYLNFIKECSIKNYGDLPTHKHHIIPKHLGGDDSDNNIIILSVDDHYKAHLLLSECFDGDNKRKNISSAIFIKRQIDNFKLLQEYQKLLKGEGNPNYGNKWDVKKRKEFSKRQKKKMNEPDVLMKLRKPKKDSSNMGKYDKNGKNNPFYNKTHSDETKLKMRNKRLGKKPTNTKQVSINGKIYNGLTEAYENTNIKPTTIWYRINSKNPKFKDYKFIL